MNRLEEIEASIRGNRRMWNMLEDVKNRKTLSTKHGKVEGPKGAMPVNKAPKKRTY